MAKQCASRKHSVSYKQMVVSSWQSEQCGRLPRTDEFVSTFGLVVTLESAIRINADDSMKHYYHTHAAKNYLINAPKYVHHIKINISPTSIQLILSYIKSSQLIYQIIIIY